MNDNNFYLEFANKDLGYDSLGKELGFIENIYELNYYIIVPLHHHRLLMLPHILHTPNHPPQSPYI